MSLWSELELPPSPPPNTATPAISIPAQPWANPQQFTQYADESAESKKARKFTGVHFPGLDSADSSLSPLTALDLPWRRDYEKIQRKNEKSKLRVKDKLEKPVQTKGMLERRSAAAGCAVDPLVLAPLAVSLGAREREWEADRILKKEIERERKRMMNQSESEAEAESSVNHENENENERQNGQEEWKEAKPIDRVNLFRLPVEYLGPEAQQKLTRKRAQIHQTLNDLSAPAAAEAGSGSAAVAPSELLRSVKQLPSAHRHRPVELRIGSDPELCPPVRLVQIPFELLGKKVQRVTDRNVGMIKGSEVRPDWKAAEQAQNKAQEEQKAANAEKEKKALISVQPLNSVEPENVNNESVFAEPPPAKLESPVKPSNVQDSESAPSLPAESESRVKSIDTQTDSDPPAAEQPTHDHPADPALSQSHSARPHFAPAVSLPASHQTPSKVPPAFIPARFHSPGPNASAAPSQPSEMPNFTNLYPLSPSQQRVQSRIEATEREIIEFEARKSPQRGRQTDVQPLEAQQPASVPVAGYYPYIPPSSNPSHSFLAINELDASFLHRFASLNANMPSLSSTDTVHSHSPVDSHSSATARLLSVEDMEELPEIIENNVLIQEYSTPAVPFQPGYGGLTQPQIHAHHHPPSIANPVLDSVLSVIPSYPLLPYPSSHSQLSHAAERHLTVQRVKTSLSSLDDRLNQVELMAEQIQREFGTANQEFLHAVEEKMEWEKRRQMEEMAQLERRVEVRKAEHRKAERIVSELGKWVDRKIEVEKAWLREEKVDEPEPIQEQPKQPIVQEEKPALVAEKPVKQKKPKGGKDLDALVAENLGAASQLMKNFLGEITRLGTSDGRSGFVKERKEKEIDPFRQSQRVPERHDHENEKERKEREDRKRRKNPNRPMTVEEILGTAPPVAVDLSAILNQTLDTSTRASNTANTNEKVEKLPLPGENWTKSGRFIPPKKKSSGTNSKPAAPVSHVAVNNTANSTGVFHSFTASQVVVPLDSKPLSSSAAVVPTAGGTNQPADDEEHYEEDFD